MNFGGIMKALKSLLSVIASLVLVFFASGASAEKYPDPGVSDTEIKIGHTNPYSGPASAYSTIGKSINAYFNKINAEGGINGRKIKLMSLDDGYSPPKTKEQFRKLVEREKVLLMFQSLGTPTNSAVHRYMNKKEVPHLFLATGATKWGDPENFPWTMGWQPNYQAEGAVFATYVLTNHPNGKIGILYQNDDYGKDYVKGLRDGLGDRADEMIVAEESYEVTDPSVDSQIIKLKASGADVFYNVATPKFAAQAIKKIYDLQWKPVQLLNSVSNSTAAVLKPVGFEKCQGIITTAYLMDPNNPNHAKTEGMVQWRQFMEQYYPDGDQRDPFNVFGFAAAQTMAHVLREAGDDLSRENIMKQAANMKDLEVMGLIEGIKINTSATDFRPIESMEILQFQGDRFVSLGEVIQGGNDLMMK